MGKIYWLLLLIPLLLLSVSCGKVAEHKTRLEEREKQYEKEEKETMSVSEQVGILLDSKEYQSAAIEQRKVLAEELLEQLLSRGEITHYDYDQRQGLYSYVEKKGVRGGILLEEFSSYMN